MNTVLLLLICVTLLVHHFCRCNEDSMECPMSANECEENDVRLVINGAVNESQGVVEFCGGGCWGPICRDREWDKNDAQVICRQLGYELEDGAAQLGLGFPGGGANYHYGRVRLSKVKCVGNENSLSNCTSTRLWTGGGSCSTGNTNAGVRCPITGPESCDDGSVRLQGEILSSEIGRVEVCFGGRWGYVCHDCWDNNDASVICRQLGFKGGVATKNSANAFSLPIESVYYYLDDVQCIGNESIITECNHPGVSVHNCHDHDNRIAGVICGSSPGEPTERCSIDRDNNTSSHTNGSIPIVNMYGTCEFYKELSPLCDPYFGPLDYVFFTESDQNVVASKLNNQTDVLGRYSENCSDLVARIVCHYFYAPCGSGIEVHRPTSICAEECTFVKQGCLQPWTEIEEQLGAIECSAIDNRSGDLTSCCTSAGIMMNENSTQAPPTHVLTFTTTSPVPSSVIGGVVGAVSFILLGVCVLFIILATVLCIRNKRKKKMVDMDVISNPATLTSGDVVFDKAGINMKAVIHTGGKGVPVKMLRGHSGSTKVPLAVPNPYPSLGSVEALPVYLSPSDNKLRNRISSSIIRELSSNLLIPFSRLKLLECVGQGEFGVVYQAEYTEPEGDINYKTTTVAVKTLKGYFDNDQVNKIMLESVKMKHFDHPNVLHLIGVCLDGGPAPYVVMPFMANGSLLHYLKKERGNIVLPHEVDEDVKIDVRKRLSVVCLQIANGMEYLAQEKFVHRDLAARNCMIDIHFVIKIADFGLSEDVYSKNYFRQNTSDKHIKLPVKWMAPESLSDGVFSEKSDVWSFGVTCWEIFSGGKTPYPGMDPLLLSQLLDTEQRLNKPMNAACSDEMYEMMMHTWVKEPSDRPTFSELLTTISDYTQKIAGYLDVNCNPFLSVSAVAACLQPEEDGERENNGNFSASEKMLPALDQPKKKKGKRSSPKPSPKSSPRHSPKVTPRSSPKVSPKASPQVSPLPSPPISPQRNVLPHNAEIKICVQSPSESGSIISETPL